MKSINLLLSSLFLIFLIFSSNNPTYAGTFWEKTLGVGSGYHIIEASDGSLVITGDIYSEHQDGICLIKVDANGEEIWTRIFQFDTEYSDIGYHVEETPDGGFIITGVINYYFPTNNGELVLIKTDSEGIEQWRHIFEGEFCEVGNSVKPTNDGGYIVVGYISNLNFKAKNYAKHTKNQKEFIDWEEDGWIIKTDAEGNEEWDLIWDESDLDEIHDVIQTPDGNYVFIHNWGSFSEEESSYNSNLVKIDNSGNIIWKKINLLNFVDKLYSLQPTSDDGFIIIGVCFGGYSPTETVLIKTDVLGNIEWYKQFYSNQDCNFTGNSAEQTSDEGFILTGSSSCSSEYNLFLIKTNLYGEEEWIQTFGGEEDDYGNSVVQTNAGGYAIVGSTQSYADYYQYIWLIYYDPSDENNQSPYPPTLIFPENESIIEPGLVDFSWLNNGDPNGDEVLSWLRTQWWNGYKWVEEITVDTANKENYLGLLLSDSTHKWTACSYDPAHKSYPHYSCAEFYDLTTSSIGEKFWERRFDGNYSSMGNNFVKTSDGGYAMIGSVQAEETYDFNIWLIKTNSEGTEEWNRVMGGIDSDIGYALDETDDGGFIITGTTENIITYESDLLLIKTDSNGNVQWEKYFDNSIYDYGYYVTKTSDNGFIITGSTAFLLWVIKTDSEGNEIWHQIFDYFIYSGGYEVHEVSNGGYIIVGYKSRICGFSEYFEDIWLIKLDTQGNLEWERAYGEKCDWDRGYSVSETTDNGFIITGTTQKYLSDDSNLWLIKTNSFGDPLWNNTFGGSDYDSGNKVIQTLDGGYAVVGQKDNNGHIYGSSKIWLIKTNQFGRKIWDITFGGLKEDVGNSVVETEDGNYVICGTTKSFAKQDACPWLIYFNPEQIENKPPYQPTLLAPENGSSLDPGFITFSWINNGDPEADPVGSWFYLIGPENQIISYDLGEDGFQVGQEISFSLMLLSGAEWIWTVYIYDPNQRSYPYYSCQEPFYQFYLKTQ